MTKRPAHFPCRDRLPLDRIGHPRILLASRSPRRAQMLLEAGIDHEVIDSGIDDGQLVAGSVAPDQWVAALAYLKAAAAAERLCARATCDGGAVLILGADTVVVDDGRIIGQPQDRADAERILSALIDGEHEVVTGVALLDPRGGPRRLFADRAQVRVGPVAPEDVRGYLDSGQWRGKAGAYNLSERLAAGWPITFEGDPGTIMGLPMRLLMPMLGDAR